MYKVKALNKISHLGLGILTDAGFDIDNDSENPEAILVRSAKLHEMEFAPNLLCIARAGAGTNNIPIDRCAESGIAVFNTPGANAEAVKELVLCGLLISSRDIVGGINWVSSLADKGDEVASLVEKGKSSFIGPEIMGKTLGVVGLGAIGAKVANAAVNLGMRVVGYDPYLSVEAALGLSRKVKIDKNLDAIYKNSDYITLQLPYIKGQTHHMINAETLAKMKDGVRIINLARAELADDEAIKAALASGKLARYVTDFPNGALAGVPGVLHIPHLGASTPESEDRCAIMAARELIDYVKNGNIINSVNLPCLSIDRAGEGRLCVISKGNHGILSSCVEVITGSGLTTVNAAGRERGEYAYVIVDTNGKIEEDVAREVEKLAGVVRVRIIDKR
ncbi:MAG: 3-phosphoglycerate dehydrogenase [Oscillospiraceae bacterium]|jgi:D-3-phosphoglycerate dehydrogenase|nr:3-phosphoglycerate dehydrogenase [Oscillospiraceae bacterium]